MSLALNGTNGVTYNDGTLQSSAPVGRNLIINGNMTIDQRNAGAAVTTNAAFPVDRYKIQYSMDGAVSAQQDTSTPAGFVNSTKLTVTTADASLGTNQFFLFRHFIEGTNTADLGFGTANAKTVTLSFWVRSSLTGTFGGSMTNSAGDRSYPFTYSISAADTWEYKTVTVAGDTTGTWLTTTGVGLRINWSMGAGTDFLAAAGSWTGAEKLGATGQTNVLGTLNATWYITGVQLEVGTTATDFENLQYTTQLQLCQRYYQEYGEAYLIGGYQSGVSEDYRRETFPVTMRATPTASSAGTWATSGTSNTKPNIAAGSNNGVTIYAVTTGGNWYMDANSVDDKLIFSAEL